MIPLLNFKNQMLAGTGFNCILIKMHCNKLCFVLIKGKAVFFRIIFGTCDPSAVAIRKDAFPDPYLPVQSQKLKL